MRAWSPPRCRKLRLRERVSAEDEAVAAPRPRLLAIRDGGAGDRGLARADSPPGEDRGPTHGFRDEALRKETLVLAASVITSLSVIWVATYSILGLYWSAAIPFAYQVVSIANLAAFARTKRYRLFRACELALSRVLPFVLQLSLGGFLPSSGVVLWSFTAPLGALLFSGRREAVRWFAAFVLVIALSAMLDPLVANETARIPRGLGIAFFALNTWRRPPLDTETSEPTGTTPGAFASWANWPCPRETAEAPSRRFAPRSACSMPLRPLVPKLTFANRSGGGFSREARVAEPNQDLQMLPLWLRGGRTY